MSGTLTSSQLDLLHLIKKLAKLETGGISVLRNICFLISKQDGIFDYQDYTSTFTGVFSNKLNDDLLKLRKNDFVTLNIVHENGGTLYRYKLSENGLDITEDTNMAEIEAFVDSIIDKANESNMDVNGYAKDLVNKSLSGTLTTKLDILSFGFVPVYLTPIIEFEKGILTNHVQSEQAVYKLITVFWIPVGSAEFRHLYQAIRQARDGLICFEGDKCKITYFHGYHQGKHVNDTHIKYTIMCEYGEFGVELFRNGLVYFCGSSTSKLNEIWNIKDLIVPSLRHHIYSIMTDVQKDLISSKYTQKAFPVFEFPHHTTIIANKEEYDELLNSKPFKHEYIIGNDKISIFGRNVACNSTNSDSQKSCVLFSALNVLNYIYDELFTIYESYWQKCIDSGMLLSDTSTHNEDELLDNLKSMEQNLQNGAQDLIEFNLMHSHIEKSLKSIEQNIQDLFLSNDVFKTNQYFWEYWVDLTKEKSDNLQNMLKSLELYLNKLTKIMESRYEEITININRNQTKKMNEILGESKISSYKIMETQYALETLEYVIIIVYSFELVHILHGLYPSIPAPYPMARPLFMVSLAGTGFLLGHFMLQYGKMHARHQCGITPKKESFMVVLSMLIKNGFWMMLILLILTALIFYSFQNGEMVAGH